MGEFLRYNRLRSHRLRRRARRTLWVCGAFVIAAALITSLLI